MNSITYSKIFHNTTWNSMLKVFKKYFGNTYAKIEIHAEIQRISCVIWNCFPKSSHKINSVVLW